MGKVCQICGKGSGMYPLCITHMNLKSQGKVVKDSSGQWIMIEEIDKKNDKINSNCILCEEKTKPGYKFCKDCYYNIGERISELDKNQKAPKLRDYYYNAKDYAMRIYDENKIYYQQLTMSAISDILKNLYEDDSLDERLERDLKAINDNLSQKNEKLKSAIKEEHKIEEIKADKDSDKAKTKKTQDGHFVESEVEISVDDALYNLGFLHAYNIKVPEITERTVQCDWYIPITFSEGIYIELWGIKGNAQYNKNKEEKISLYKKHKLSLIELQYDEVRSDTSRLNSTLKSRISEEKNKIINRL